MADTMTMIERVARAMFDELHRQGPVPPFGYADSGEDGKQTILDGAYDLAAVAIAAMEAMRVPTDAMREAGVDTSGWDGVEYKVDETWASMIDAALQEQ